MHRLTLAMITTSLLAMRAPARADGEWLACPSVGVATRIDPLLKDGKLLCTYFHQSRSEILAQRSVSSRSGQPLRSCLRDNAGYGTTGSRYASRAFCSTTLTQDQLDKTAYKWAPWTGVNRNLTRVRLGHTNKSGGQFYLCRVKDKGYRLGRIVGTSCEYYKDNRVVLSAPATTQSAPYDHLLLATGYGVPSAYPRNPSSRILLDPAANVPPGGPRPLLCTTPIAPDAFDFQGITGVLPGIHLAGVCSSHAGHKHHVANAKRAGDLAGLE